MSNALVSVVALIISTGTNTPLSQLRQVSFGCLDLASLTTRPLQYPFSQQNTLVLYGYA